jgi:hypothetical protein
MPPPLNTHTQSGTTVIAALTYSCCGDAKQRNTYVWVRAETPHRCQPFLTVIAAIYTHIADTSPAVLLPTLLLLLLRLHLLGSWCIRVVIAVSDEVTAKSRQCSSQTIHHISAHRTRHDMMMVQQDTA